MDWADIFGGISLPSVTWSAIGGLAILGVLTGKFITLREHKETLARITMLEKLLGEERDAHQETRETLREVATQNGTLIAAAQISTEVMKRVDKHVQQSQEGGGS